MNALKAGQNVLQAVLGAFYAKIEGG